MVILIKKVLGLSIAALLFRVLTSSADIDGRPVYMTGNNPHGWSSEALTNIVQRTTDIPEKQETNILSNSFYIFNDFTQIHDDYVDTNSLINTFDENGNRYNVTRFNEDQWCTTTFEVDLPGASNSIPLEEGVNLYATVFSDNKIYGLNPNMDYTAEGDSFYILTCLDLGDVIGVRDSGIDTDGDYLTDDKETYVTGTSTNNPDSDNDGMLDGEEYYTGSDPLNSNDTFGISGLSVSNNNINLYWDGKSNITYNIERSTNLLDGDFTSVSEITPSIDEVQTFSETNVFKQVYYRIKADISNLLQ